MRFSRFERKGVFIRTISYIADGQCIMTRRQTGKLVKPVRTGSSSPNRSILYMLKSDVRSFQWLSICFGGYNPLQGSGLGKTLNCQDQKRSEERSVGEECRK